MAEHDDFVIGDLADTEGEDCLLYTSPQFHARENNF